MHFQGSVMGRNISKTVFCHTSVQCTVCSSHILDSELLSFVRQIDSGTVISVQRKPIYDP